MVFLSDYNYRPITSFIYMIPFYVFIAIFIILDLLMLKYCKKENLHKAVFRYNPEWGRRMYADIEGIGEKKVYIGPDDADIKDGDEIMVYYHPKIEKNPLSKYFGSAFTVSGRKGLKSAPMGIAIITAFFSACVAWQVYFK